jgi:hypothetical protein
MKRANTKFAQWIGRRRTLILAGTLAMAVTLIACSRNSKVAVSGTGNPHAVPPNSGETTVGRPSLSAPTVRPVALQRGEATPVVKPSASKLLVYRSRDYGVSFVYPWQYAYISAKTVAKGDASLRPKSDGHEGQFTLARVEVPSGFYPDTDFESGYFTLSLNPELSEQECEATLSPGKDGKVETETINGVDFRWVETESGGRGNASKVRNYVVFTNATCYELELGVKTSNRDGMAREVDPDQVMRRLDGMLRSVKIVQATQNPPQVETTKAEPVSQN